MPADSLGFGEAAEGVSTGRGARRDSCAVRPGSCWAAEIQPAVQGGPGRGERGGGAPGHCLALMPPCRRAWLQLYVDSRLTLRASRQSESLPPPHSPKGCRSNAKRRSRPVVRGSSFIQVHPPGFPQRSRAVMVFFWGGMLSTLFRESPPLSDSCISQGAPGQRERLLRQVRLRLRSFLLALESFFLFLLFLASGLLRSCSFFRARTFRREPGAGQDGRRQVTSRPPLFPWKHMQDPVEKHGGLCGALHLWRQQGNLHALALNEGKWGGGAALVFLN